MILALPNCTAIGGGSVGSVGGGYRSHVGTHTAHHRAVSLQPWPYQWMIALICSVGGTYVVVFARFSAACADICSQDSLLIALFCAVCAVCFVCPGSGGSGGSCDCGVSSGGVRAYGGSGGSGGWRGGCGVGSVGSVGSDGSVVVLALVTHICCRW